jgi:hypothetical protein
MTVLTRRIGSGGGSAPCPAHRRIAAVRIGDLAQDRTRMTPFAVQQVWRAGRPVPVSEKGSTLALLFEATVQRITAAVTSPSGCACCRCAIRIRRDQFRTLSRVYCSHCASDPATAEATAGCEHGAIALRFRVRVPPSAVAKSALKQPAGAAAC